MPENIIPDDDDVLAAVRAALVAVLAPEDLNQVDLAAVGLHTPMLSLPLDSAVLMALTTELEDSFGVYIDEEAAFSFGDIGDIAGYIRQRREAKARRLERS